MKITHLFKILTGTPATMNINGPNIIVYGDSVLGVSESFNTGGINVYPNPSSDFIKFKDEKSVLKSEIFDATGKVLISTSDKEIDVRKLPKGTYYVKQYLENVKNVSGKFIKK